MKISLIIFSFLLAATGYSQDYSVKDSLNQIVELENINFLKIECYCNNGVEINEIKTKSIRINVVGKLDSEGYHGDQKSPEEIPEKTLSFKTEIKKDTLHLISREWTVIHHAYMIENLSLEIPLGLEYEILKVKGNDLEGREIN